MEPDAANDDGEWSCVDVEEFDALSIDFKLKPKEKYPAKLHARSVAKHLGVKQGLIYLPGMPERHLEDSDQPVPFRQRRYFYYLSGVDFANCFLTYNIQKDTLTFFIQRPTTGISVVFNGSSPTVEEVETKYDVDRVLLSDSLGAHLVHFAHRELGKIYILDESQSPGKQISQKLLLLGNGQQSTLLGSPVDSLKLKNAMNAARVIKSPYEIKLLRKANVISARAHTNVLRSLKNLTNEAEIEAIFAATCISEQAKQQAYGIIAASGGNASTLHYIANNEPLKGRQLVCLDAGCEWDCYASDVTRTFPISGTFTPEAKKIYDIVARMQDSCIKMIRPGVNFRDVHMHAHAIAVRGLMDLGILHNGDFEEVYKSGASVAFFMHGLGHHLGLECHDVESSSLRNLYGLQEKSWLINYHEMLKKPSASVSELSPGMVVTVEPGIYFSHYSLDHYIADSRYGKYINKDLLKYYYPVGGVRIEDDILVTGDGFENLTTTPKGEEALKIINEGTKADDVVAIPSKRYWLW